VVWRVGPHACSIACGTGRDPERHESVVQRSLFLLSPLRGRDQEEERSRDRGRKGHRILGRVLVGGRHFGSSRAILFHERVVTATSAASSRINRRRLTLARAEAEGFAKAIPSLRRKRKRRQECQRYDRWLAPWDEQAHARYPGGSRETDGIGGTWQCVTRHDPPKRQRRRETPLSPVHPSRPKTSRDIHAAKAAAASREHTRYGSTSIVQVADVGRTHHASWSLPRASRKARSR